MAAWLMRGKWRNLKAVATQLLCYMIVLLSTKNEKKYCFNRRSFFGVRAIWTRTSCLWLQIQSESGAANLKLELTCLSYRDGDVQSKCNSEALQCIAQRMLRNINLNTCRPLVPAKHKCNTPLNKGGDSYCLQISCLYF